MCFFSTGSSVFLTKLKKFVFDGVILTNALISLHEYVIRSSAGTDFPVGRVLP